MGRWLLLASLFASILTGCTSSPPAKEGSPPVVTKTAPPPPDPEQALYEKVRAGNYQADAALAALERAHTTIRGMEGQGEVLGEARIDLKDLMDSAGGTLAEVVHERPTLEAFKKDFAKSDGKRLAAIDQTNDALRELLEAKGIAASLLQDATPATKKALAALDASIGEAVEAATEAVKAYGGEPAKEGEDPAP